MYAFVLHEWYRDWLENIITNERTASFVYNLSVVIVTIILAYATVKFAKWFFYKMAQLFEKKTEHTILKALKASKFFSRVSYYIPLVILRYSLSILLPDTPRLINLLDNIFKVLAVILFVLIINSALNAFVELNQYKKANRSKPIKGLVQFVQVIIWFFASIICLSIVFSESPMTVIGGLGAASAVLMLIFKDSITGLVAGVQLSLNKSIEIGDWISLPKYDADGEVIDITMTSIKIQNWDKTISIIPSYNLMITDSVKNHKGMIESGGRRIMRKLPIDMLSITFCTSEKIQQYQNTDYVKAALSRVMSINASNGELSVANVNIDEKEKELTNLGLFRTYLYDYLFHHERIHSTMDLMVRQGQPDNYGIPLEVYCFTKTTKWAEYENIQSEIFEHIFAVLPYFDLRVFQSPLAAAAIIMEKGDSISMDKSSNKMK